MAGFIGVLIVIQPGSAPLSPGMGAAALAALAANIGANAGLWERMAEANTAGEVLPLAREHDLPLADTVAARAREVALATLSGGIELDVVVIDRAGTIVGRAGA